MRNLSAQRILNQTNCVKENLQKKKKKSLLDIHNPQHSIIITIPFLHIMEKKNLQSRKTLSINSQIKKSTYKLVMVSIKNVSKKKNKSVKKNIENFEVISKVSNFCAFSVRVSGFI